MRPTTYLAMTVCAATLLAACREKTPPEKPPTPVRVRPVEDRAATDALRYSASIEPHEQVSLAFKVNGYVREILQVPGVDGRARDVQEGDVVAQDTILARLQESSFQDKVNEAKAQLAAAEAAFVKAAADWKRASDLFATQSITAPDHDRTRKEYDTARAQVDGARAQLAAAKLNLGYCALPAPLPGVVLQRNIEVGTLVNPGTTAFVLADVSSVKAVFGVPDVILKDLHVGSPLAIVTQSIPDTEFSGRITAIAPAAAQKSRVFNIEVTVPNGSNQLKVGMITSLRVQTGEPPARLAVVPLSAIVRSPTDPSGHALFVVEKTDDQTLARLRTVQLGDVYGDGIAVTQGVRAGEPVIVTGATLVTDGQAVKVIP